MDEKMRILKMVEEGKLTAEQAVNLINALDQPVSPAAEAGDEEAAFHEPICDEQYPAIQTPSSYENRMLRILVDSCSGDKVNVQLPVKVIREVLKLTGKLPIQSNDLDGIDLEALTAAIVECMDSETLGDIVEVHAADGSTVRVFIG